jgi:hypothetical protein
VSCERPLPVPRDFKQFKIARFLQLRFENRNLKSEARVSERSCDLRFRFSNLSCRNLAILNLLKIPRYRQAVAHKPCLAPKSKLRHY